jgi:hypothetical protein
MEITVDLEQFQEANAQMKVQERAGEKFEAIAEAIL